MLNQLQALHAYRGAGRFRSQREQEADVFRQVNSALLAAREGTAIRQVRALADNRRLWTMVADLMRDPSNQLPASLRAQILSLALRVQQEMDQEAPDFSFLISINEDIAAGLAGNT
ncbi:MAG: transcriptional regulator [Rhodospirillales bacterium]|nr:transcriptional regulator [Acetobacter sp.]